MSVTKFGSVAPIWECLTGGKFTPTLTEIGLGSGVLKRGIKNSLAVIGAKNTVDCVGY